MEMQIKNKMTYYYISIRMTKFIISETSTDKEQLDFSYTNDENTK